jgi:hypothetical protein
MHSVSVDVPPCPELSPWWLVSAGSIIAALCAAVGKLYRDNAALRAAAVEREAAIEADHKRDLRRVIWGPTDPPKRK